MEIQKSYKGIFEANKKWVEKIRTKAKPTEVKPREDPSPTESRRSANETAYTRDAESFHS